MPILLICFCAEVNAQVNRTIRITVLNENKIALPGSTVHLMTTDSVSVRTLQPTQQVHLRFTDIKPAIYLIKASELNHENGFSKRVDLKKNTSIIDTIILRWKTSLLKDVTVVSKKAFVQFLPDKTVINPEANISNAGATVMDVLEKSPGITVGKDGSIIMKGKPAVTVFIDGKPTQLSGADLQAYLSGLRYCLGADHS